MGPKTCATDPHNEVVYCNGSLKTRDGMDVTASYKSQLAEGAWSDTAPYTQSITVNGLLASDEPFVDINMGFGFASDYYRTLSLEEYYKIGRMAVTADNTLTAYAYEEKPTRVIPLIVKVVR
jgi:hypothetical protein